MKYFTAKEIKGLNQRLVSKLILARNISKTPYIITSGLRSPKKNARLKKSVKNSAHLKGLAVDLRATTSPKRFQILEGLILAGFRRIGIYKTHIHADVDSTKPMDVCWLA